MAWLKGMLGGMAGAFGYTQMKEVETKDIAQSILGILARDGGGSKAVVAATVDPHMNELTKQLRELQMQIQANRSQPVTIVTGHSANKGYSYIIVPSGVLGVVLLYLRYVKGWRIMDFMYVTRASLQGLKSTVAELQTSMAAGISKVQEEVSHKTKVLVQHLGLVQKKQEDLLTQQQALDTRVEELGENVDEQLTQLNGSVESIQNEMGEMHQKVELSTRGMLLLCQSIAEMCRFVNFHGQSVNAIESYLQGASAAVLPPPGAAGQAGGSQQQQQQQQGAIQGPPPLQALPPGTSGQQFELPALESLLTITEEPTATPTASVAPAPASGAPSSSNQGQASTSRNARAKSDSTDSRSQNYRASPYFNMFSMGRNVTRSASLPANHP